MKELRVKIACLTRNKSSSESKLVQVSGLVDCSGKPQRNAFKTTKLTKNELVIVNTVGNEISADYLNQYLRTALGVQYMGNISLRIHFTYLAIECFDEFICNKLYTLLPAIEEMIK